MLRGLVQQSPMYTHNKINGRLLEYLGGVYDVECKWQLARQWLMLNLISPEYNFELFCYRVLSGDPEDYIALIDTISGEAALALRLHKKTTRESDFRKGSRGRKYRKDLQDFVRILMNGRIPSDTSPEFIEIAKPLIQKILLKHEIGDLRRSLSENAWIGGGISKGTTGECHVGTGTGIKSPELPGGMASIEGEVSERGGDLLGSIEVCDNSRTKRGCVADEAGVSEGSEVTSAPDFVNIVVSKQEVLALDTRSVMTALRALIASPVAAKRWFESVDISIDGYNHVAEELFEIPEVREYVGKLDDEFPFWLFFLSKRNLGLQCIAYCFLPPFLTPDARATYFPTRLDRLLSARWFPAMNQVCEWVGMSDEEIEKLSDRSVSYLLSGPE